MSTNLFDRFLATLRRGRTLVAVAAFASAVAGPLPARAALLQVDGITFNQAGGQIIPCVKVAFDPLSPPTAFQLRVAPDGAARPVLTQSNATGRTFSAHIAVLDGATGAVMPLFPPGPCRDGTCQQFTVGATAADGTRLLLVFSITSPQGLLDPGTIRGFNPQPEPPGFPAGALEVDFALAGSGPATANMTLTVYNQSTGRVVAVQ